MEAIIEFFYPLSCTHATITHGCEGFEACMLSSRGGWKEDICPPPDICSRKPDSGNIPSKIPSLTSIEQIPPDVYPSPIPYVFTARRYASAVLAVIVCPSVCLFVTSRSYTKVAKPRITQTTPYDNTGTLVF